MTTNARNRNRAVNALNGKTGRHADAEPSSLDYGYALRRLHDAMATRPSDWQPDDSRTKRDNPIGATRWVHAFGRQRRGIVVAVTPTYASVAYVVPTSPDDIKIARARHHVVTDRPMGRP